jgi:hypothetical protein
MPAGCLAQLICGLRTCSCCASTCPPFPPLFIRRYSNCVSMRQSAILFQSRYTCLPSHGTPACPVTNGPSISEVQVTL